MEHMQPSVSKFTRGSQQCPEVCKKSLGEQHMEWNPTVTYWIISFAPQTEM